MTLRVRRLATLVEEVRIEGGRAVDPPLRRAAALAAIENPFSGRFVEDLSEIASMGAELGDLLPRRALALLGVSADAVQSFGKAALVGEDGELEHAAALLHPSFGAPLRALLGRGAALIPSSKKRGGVGASFDVPLGHTENARVRSHFDGMEVRMPDAPRPHEIVVALALSLGGRPHARVGGLSHSEALTPPG